MNAAGPAVRRELGRFGCPVRLRETCFVAGLERGQLSAVPAGLGLARGPFASQLVLDSGWHEDVGELGRAYLNQRQIVSQSLRPLGLGLIAASSHPAADWREQQANEPPGLSKGPLPLRRALVNTLAFDAASDDSRILAAFEVLSYLAVPLTASSPYWNGIDSGGQSVVQTILGELPGTGFLHSAALQRDLALRPAGITWPFSTWHGRPLMHLPASAEPPHGMISVRCDVPTDPRDALALAEIALQLLQDESPCRLATMLAAPANLMECQENYWRAGKSGLAAVFAHQELGMLGLREGLGEILTGANPAQYDGLARILAEGTSADRQRAVFQARKTLGYSDASALQDVAIHLLNQTWICGRADSAESRLPLR